MSSCSSHPFVVTQGSLGSSGRLTAIVSSGLPSCAAPGLRPVVCCVAAHGAPVGPEPSCAFVLLLDDGKSVPGLPGLRGRGKGAQPRQDPVSATALLRWRRRRAHRLLFMDREKAPNGCSAQMRVAVRLARETARLHATFGLRPAMEQESLGRGRQGFAFTRH
jgi:hypothetical protein